MNTTNRTVGGDSRRRTGGARAFTLAAILSFATLTPVGAAVADASSSTGYYGPVNGHNYSNYARMINSNPSFAIANTTVAKNGSGSVPAGWMGATARMFDLSNLLVAESGYAYTSVSASSFGRGVQRTVHGQYYSYGVTRAWTGSAYNSYYTTKSPLQNW